MNTNDSIQSLLRRIEALLHTWPHLIPWVEQMVSNVERQNWQAPR